MVVSLRNPTGLAGSPSHPARHEILDAGEVVERGLVSQVPVSSCRSAAGQLVTAPRGAQVSAEDRHLAAVARSLGWAEQAAARGDYADALSWIAVVEAIGDLIPIEYETKRQAWLIALARNRASNEGM